MKGNLVRALAFKPKTQSARANVLRPLLLLFNEPQQLAVPLLGLEQSAFHARHPGAGNAQAELHASRLPSRESPGVGPPSAIGAAPFRRMRLPVRQASTTARSKRMPSPPLP